MGSWGYDSFENDDALDFVGELCDGADLTPVVRVLTDVVETGENYLEAPPSSAAIPAAEVIAALKDAPNSNLPDDVLEWIGKYHPVVTDELVNLSLTALARIKSDSELKELWDETDNADSWYQAINNLEKRLNG